MKSASEWAKEMIEDRDSWESQDWNFDPDGTGPAFTNYVPNHLIEAYVKELAEDIQQDAIKAAAYRVRGKRNAARRTSKKHHDPNARDWSGVTAEYLDELFRELIAMTEED